MSTLTGANTVSLPSAIGRFALHFVEMCVVMCMGGGLLDFAVFSFAAALGYPDLPARASALSIMLIAIDGTVVMAGYMFLRRHPLQHNLEMSGSTLLGGVAFVGALWLGWLPQSIFASWSPLFAFVCGPLCALMFLVMLVRFDHYGGRVGAVIASAAAGAWTCSMHPEIRQAQAGRCPICGMTLIRRV